MKTKLRDCFTNILVIYLLASVFYPCCKLDGLKNYLDVYYTCLNLKVNTAVLCINIRTLFVELYDSFAKSFGISVEQSGTPYEVPSSSSLLKGYQLLALKGKTLGSSSSSTSSKPKLESYLATSFVFVDNNSFDTLQWWKEHQKCFSVLATIVK